MFQILSKFILYHEGRGFLLIGFDKRIEKGMYIHEKFILNVGDYNLTSAEIHAIRDNSFSHGIYVVEYMYESGFRAPWLVVTVNN